MKEFDLAAFAPGTLISILCFCFPGDEVEVLITAPLQASLLKVHISEDVNFAEVTFDLSECGSFVICVFVP